jgi:hypothetical protein
VTGLITSSAATPMLMTTMPSSTSRFVVDMGPELS